MGWRQYFTGGEEGRNNSVETTARLKSSVVQLLICWNVLWGKGARATIDVLQCVENLVNAEFLVIVIFGGGGIRS